MFKNLLTRLVGSDSDKALARLGPLVERCNALEPEMMKLTDAELRAKTDEFKARLADGETLDDLMPEAFAVVREASRRVNNMRHYDVQLVGGALLHQGKIAEMRTGEGKTLVATLPLYLNALLGKGVHLVTQNDYLAKRDAQWMGKVYHFLGLRTGIIQSAGDGRPDDATYEFDPTYPSTDDRFLNLRPIKRKQAYECDITYGTNNEFGFDYLRDNMTTDLAECVQRVDEDGQPLLYFAVIDEVDNLLIDEARTPLIISGPADEPSGLYKRFAELVRRLEPSKHNDFKNPDGDYIVEAKSKNVTLTEQGISKIEKWLGIDNLYSPEHAEMTPYLDNALRAHVIYERDRDYVVSDKGEIIIVDEFTGRLMYGRRFSEGLHQAIEAKEGVKVQRESFTYATITFQNFFKMYDKLAGMTGTAMTEAEEFFKIYNLEVVPLPTHIEYQAMQKKLIEKQDKFVDGSPVTVYIDPKTDRKYYKRLDYPDLVFKTAEAKFKAVVNEIAETHKTGRPVLVGTIAIETSEHLSRMLDRRGIPHQVLNAKQHEKEATVIAQAGRSGAVTIATNMAGRGVDILLGGNPEGIARDKLRKAGKDLTQITPEEWRAALAEATRETEEDKKKVLALGGLHVIGTERHEARRIDNQLRGRCARQGDPGSTRFYVSLDDELMRRFGGERVKSLMERMKMEDDVPLEYGILSKSIEQAQEKVEGYNFDIRKHVVQYDDVINRQREVIYRQRRTILEKDDLRENVMDLVAEELEEIVKDHTAGDLPENWDLHGLLNQVRAIVPLPRDFDPAQWAKGTRDEIVDYLISQAEQRYDAGLGEFAKILQTQMTLAGVTLEQMRLGRDPMMRCIHRWVEKHFTGEPEEFAAIEPVPLNEIPAEHHAAISQGFFDGVRLFRDRAVLIQTVDQHWVKHLTDLDELREGIGLRAFAQRNPLVEFRTEASRMYEDMLASIREQVAHRIFNVQFNMQAPRPQRQQQPQRAAAVPVGARSPIDRAIERGALKTSGGSATAAGAGNGKPKPAASRKLGRNDICPFCDSGKKVKACQCEGARKWRGEL
ncbi:MAG: preprotein translocase subunit SecA [Candidatus Brachytrichaceae bacterium NZ_4S206]|jgi:preprotein translocase subunit SecA